jgi:general secretion pathway protein C
MSRTTIRQTPFSRLAIWLPLAVLGALASYLLWPLLLPQSPEIVALDTQPPPRSGGADPEHEPASPLPVLGDIPLFGIAPAGSELASLPLPGTRLDLRLVGVVAGGSTGQDRAIIAEGGIREGIYRVGDWVSGGDVRLHQILADRVILQRGEGYEALHLPRELRGSGTTTPGSWEETAPPQSSDDAGGMEPGPTLARPLDGERLLTQTRRVNRDGRVYGLEVRRDGTTQRFAWRTALRPGDVILSVNGVPAATIRARRVSHTDLLADGRMDLIVERNGEVRQISIDLANPGTS